MSESLFTVKLRINDITFPLLYQPSYLINGLHIFEGPFFKCLSFSKFQFFLQRGVSGANGQNVAETVDREEYRFAMALAHFEGIVVSFFAHKLLA